ncbi:alpha-1,3-rhamnosyl/mannosyltransferase [Sphingobium sp. B7D2B]|uniref:glycosyltransferase family 4 protein n=1 Tax=Sphingobium sp. B7D2B TaxID=2940583 RepID=UPI002225838A|nr:glycosyltransferase family 1 protein [Sphingobium sp. B7D2B]MCW2366810.1 alpha-1,3-rhamnosyl/mannosyltransferase [Sphingobium sp. B7D2B]
MRIVLCVEAITVRPTGIGRYSLELAKRVGFDPRICEASFLRQSRWIADPTALIEGEVETRRRRKWRRRFDAFMTRRAIRSALVHGPNYFLPDQADTGVVTIHDLSVFKYPETHPTERLQDFDRRFSRTLARAPQVITDSKTMRGEIIAFSGLPPERVSVVNLGVSDEFTPHLSDVCSSTLKKYGLTYARYALSVAAFEPRKKFLELVAAYRLLPLHIRLRYPLVIAGGAGWCNERAFEEVSRAQAEGWVRMLGYVPEADLPYLYAASSLFLYPSIYEGFGLPPIEAMASGVPAIVSDRSCLSEVTGGAALQVDPDDIEKFSVAIERGLTDDLWRTKAIEAGLRVAKSYSWKRCVKETVDVYQIFWNR